MSVEQLIAWPVEKPTTPAGKRAAELHAAWVKEHERIAAVEGERAAAKAALRDANEKLRDAHYAAAQAGKSGKAVAEAEAAFMRAEEEATAPWGHRLEAPERTAEDARDAYLEHISEHLEEVLSEPEMADAAEAAREGVIEATAAQAEAFDEWRRVARAHEVILSAAEDINLRALPDLSPAARELRSAGERLVEAEASRPTAGSNALLAPCVSQRHLDDRRILRGEAEAVEVEVDGTKGIEVVAT